MELPEIVISSVRSGQVVLFAGKGISLGSKMQNGGQTPSESILRNALAEKFLKDQDRQGSLQWITELAISETDIGTVQDFIAEKFHSIHPADFHLILPTFKWRGIVTTNFDCLIENTYEKSQNRVQELIPIISNEDRVDEKLKSANSLALLKLHGCITRTRDPKLPIILTTDQYSTHKESRDRLFKICYEWCRENTVIFIGNGSQDSELRSIILQVLNEVKVRPPYYLLQPGITDTERKLWQSKGITILEGNFEDFIQSLDRRIEKRMRPLAQALRLLDHPIEKKFIKNEPIVGALKDLLTHDAEYVHEAIEIKESTPKQFYKGFDLGWYPIIKGLDVKRRLIDTVIDDVILKSYSDGATISELCVIKAEAGAGKTIFLRRLAWEAANYANVICLFVKNNPSTINFESIRDLYRLTKERIFIFIDAAADNISLILLLLEKARSYEIPLTIITAVRINEWNMSCDKLKQHVTAGHTLRYLSEKEILGLVNLLEKHDALGPNLRDKNTEQRVKEFGEKAGRQLLVALHEATLGRPFREIIVDEYQHIYPKQAQDLYFTVCFLNRLGAPVRAGLIARVHNISFNDFEEKLFAPLEDVVQAKRKSSDDICYSARHPQIAQIIFEEILTEDADRYSEFVRVLKYINISFESDNSSFRKLMKAKALEEIFSSSDDVKAIYEVTRECIGEDNAYLYQQMANYERITSNGNYQLAEDFLRLAQELDPRDSSIVHSQAELALTRARKAEHSLERRKFRNQALKFLEGLIRTNKSESDRYARTTYLKLAIDDLKYTLDQENPTNRDVEDAMRVIEKHLSDIKQKYPEDVFVNNLESEFAELTTDDERALKALENAFEINSRDPYITMRLSNLYKTKKDFQSAKSCLCKALESQTLNRELNYEYAQILRCTNPMDIDTLIYYFGRSFSRGSKNYLTQFWYARYLFESSELDKTNEARNLFQNLRSEPINYEVQMKIRDYIKSNFDKKLFLGRVLRLNIDLGFIAIDGRGDEIFFHKNDININTWNSIRIGSKISFNIGFTFNGPIAVNVEAN
jgi:cold shock CspA family protein